MMINPVYSAQVDLLLRVIPFVAEEEVFALKGGTAINLFIRNLPRMSVDIDLSYLPFDDRKTALAKIELSLRRIKNRIENSKQGIRVVSIPIAGNDAKLNISEAVYFIDCSTINNLKKDTPPMQKDNLVELKKPVAILFAQ